VDILEAIPEYTDEEEKEGEDKLKQLEDEAAGYEA
jgi:hypothetical protein